MTNFPSVAVIMAFYVLEALSVSLPVVTPRPQLNASVDEHDLLRQRAITTEMSTCGYENGDPTLIRTANSGYDCRVDTAMALWGFCPTTVISASDCGLAGYCIDTGSCSDGCGSLSDVSTITTFTWCVSSAPALSCDATNSTSTDSDAPFCSTALLTFGVDQTYSYIACGATAVTQHYDITPTTTSTSATTTSSTSQSASSISSSSGDLPSSSTSASVGSTSTAAAAAEDSNSSGKSSSVNTGAIVGGVLGGIAIICVCVVAVVFLMKRGRGRESPDNAQPQPEPQSPPPGVQPIENQESKPFMAYDSGGTTRQASFVSELPGSAQWPELSELAAGYDRQGHPNRSRRSSSNAGLEIELSSG